MDLVIASITSTIIPIGVYVLHRSSFSFSKLLLCYIAFSFVIDALCCFADPTEQYYGMHVFCTGEFVFMTFLFRKLFARQSPYVLPIILHLSLCIYLATALNTGISTLMNCLGISFFKLFVIGYCVAALARIMRGPALTERIEHTAFFWVITSILLYMAGDFLIFLFGNEMIHGNYRDFILKVWPIHLILNILKNSGLAVAFACRRE